MPYVQIVYQVVFATKYRAMALAKPGRQRLFDYFRGVLRNHNCTVHEIGGVSDHVHIVFGLHPSVALADLVKALKLSSHEWIDAHGIFPAFDRWSVGYAAFTYNREALPNLRRYVRNQERHHGEESSRDELRRLLRENGVEYHEEYLD